MKRLQRAALLSELAERLLDHDSWCGETHLQKAVYILQELLHCPMGLKFILYKHGTFSFDLRADLTAMRADSLLERRVRAAGYGPSLAPTQQAQSLRQRYPKALGRYEQQIRFVADTVGAKNVDELERLSTALYVTLTGPAGTSAEERAVKIHELKPHVTLDQARAAVAAVDELIEQADRQGLLSEQ